MFRAFSNVILGYIVSKERKLPEIKENRSHNQYAKIENSQEHDLVLSLFYLEFHFHHGPNYKIVMKNQSF
jgi:hypothetical protein